VLNVHLIGLGYTQTIKGGIYVLSASTPGQQKNTLGWLGKEQMINLNWSGYESISCL
jgi:hypothetical protein